jgi:hypothetical protein
VIFRVVTLGFRLLGARAYDPGAFNQNQTLHAPSMSLPRLFSLVLDQP